MGFVSYALYVSFMALWYSKLKIDVAEPKSQQLIKYEDQSNWNNLTNSILPRAYVKTF